MRQCIIGSFVAAILAFAISAASASASQHTAIVSKTPFSGNLCSIPSAGELSAANITEPCTKDKTVTSRPRKFAGLGGAAGSILYGAHWGVGKTVPGDVLAITVEKLTGSGDALKLSEVMAATKIKHAPDGFIPIGPKKGEDAELEVHPLSCENPPTGVCTEGMLFGQVGPYVILIGLTGHAPTNPAIPENSKENSPAEIEAAEAQAKAYADDLEAPIREIAKSVAAKL